MTIWADAVVMEATMMMKTLPLAAGLVFGLVLMASQAEAISRYNSTSMSCDRIRATVRNEGAVILRWQGRSGAPRFGRFVADGRFCSGGERAEISYVPSADRKSCPVRECKYFDPYDDGVIFRFGRR